MRIFFCLYPVPFYYNYLLIFFYFRSSNGGGAVVLSSTTFPVTDQIPSCPRYSGDIHESSDEAEVEFAEELERTSCHYSSYHPRPISVRTAEPLLEIP